MKTLCVYCGSSAGKDPLYKKEAAIFAALMARKEIDLVYGGANIGIMHTLAETILEAGGKVTGVMPRNLLKREVGHTGLSKMYIVETMNQRKELMGELADGFVALPGGFGTYDELFEVLTWNQLGISDKPVGALNINGYFDPLISLIEKGISEGFIREEHRDCLIVETEGEKLLERMAAFQPIHVEKWIDRLKEKGY